MEDPVADAILNQYFRRLEQALSGLPASAGHRSSRICAHMWRSACRRSPITRMRRSWRFWIASGIPMRSRARRLLTMRCPTQLGRPQPTDSAATRSSRQRLSEEVATDSSRRWSS